MDGLPRVFVTQRSRLSEIAHVAARYGFADWVWRMGGIGVIDRLAIRVADSELSGLSTGERLRRAMTELGTTWIKFGQMLSLRPDLVGDDIASALERLQADVLADPPGVAVARVESELGRPIDEVFASFEAEPFASGSVAQVHRATLLDGTAVAVKVVHDGTAARVQSDLELMRALADYLASYDEQLARYRPKVVIDEFDQMIRNAIDLGAELRNLGQFRANFADEPDVLIPRGYAELSTGQVLTMTMMYGEEFTDRAAVEQSGWDVDALVTRIAEIYLEMALRDGVYHADPHPRNFLLPDDQHVVILDFGDIGHVSTPRRRQLEALVIAVGTGDSDGVADVVIEVTTPPPGTDLARLRNDIDTWLSRYLLPEVARLDMAGIVNSVMRVMHDHKLALPADLSLMFRVLLNLQGLARSVGSTVEVTELLEPYVGQMMAKRFSPRRVARDAVRTARKWDRLIASLPDELQSIVDQASAGQVGVDMRLRDPDQKVDHLVNGMMAAASVLASSQLISRRVGPTIAGISVPGIVAGAVATVLWQRRPTRRARTA